MNFRANVGLGELRTLGVDGFKLKDTTTERECKVTGATSEVVRTRRGGRGLTWVVTCFASALNSELFEFSYLSSNTWLVIRMEPLYIFLTRSFLRTAASNTHSDQCCRLQFTIEIIVYYMFVAMILFFYYLQWKCQTSSPVIRATTVAKMITPITAPIFPGPFFFSSFLLSDAGRNWTDVSQSLSWRTDGQTEDENKDKMETLCLSAPEEIIN